MTSLSDRVETALAFQFLFGAVLGIPLQIAHPIRRTLDGVSGFLGAKRATEPCKIAPRLYVNLRRILFAMPVKRVLFPMDSFRRPRARSMQRGMDRLGPRQSLWQHSRAVFSTSGVCLSSPWPTAIDRVEAFTAIVYYSSGKRGMLASDTMFLMAQTSPSGLTGVCKTPLSSDRYASRSSVSSGVGLWNRNGKIPFGDQPCSLGGKHVHA